MIHKIKVKIKNKKRDFEKITDEEQLKKLSTITCDGCHNKCRLDKIKCPRGIQYQNKHI